VIPTFIKSYEVSADVEPFRIARFSDAAASQKVAQAAANTDPIIGVFDRMGGKTGRMTDVVRAGLASVRLGGTVQSGDPLTSDANGKAIKAVAAPGQTRRIVGFADQPGVADDIIDAWIAPGLLHEPD
jgi:hypothetical protein